MPKISDLQQESSTSPLKKRSNSGSKMPVYFKLIIEYGVLLHLSPPLLVITLLSNR